MQELQVQRAEQQAAETAELAEREAEELQALHTQMQALHTQMQQAQVQRRSWEKRATNAEFQLKQLGQLSLQAIKEVAVKLPPATEAEAAAAKSEAEREVGAEAIEQLASVQTSLDVSELVMREVVGGLETQQRLLQKEAAQKEIQLRLRLQQATAKQELRERELGECAVKRCSWF